MYSVLTRFYEKKHGKSYNTDFKIERAKVFTKQALAFLIGIAIGILTGVLVIN